MELDARRLLREVELEADICIVGAGPAGISLAREFIGSNVNVLILESGGLKPDERVQELNEGLVVGDPYAGLRKTRYRRVGGTTHIWNTLVRGKIGAKYVPLDPWDFEEREDVPYSGWPFDLSHLEPFYVRAQNLCGLGPFAYDVEQWSDWQSGHLTLEEPLTTRVYQFGVSRLFTRVYLRDIIESRNVRLCHNITLCQLETEGKRRSVVGAKAACLSGRHLRVRATHYVLAAGAIENARILLLSGGNPRDAFGNRYGWVGRCLMEHPRDHALMLLPASPKLFDEAGFYDAHEASDGTIVGGRIALEAQGIQRARLPNASITLLPSGKSPRSTTGAAARLHTRILGFLGLHQQMHGYGWSRNANAKRNFDVFRLLVNAEQRPNPENKIVLSKQRDPLGVPQVEMHWRWREDEQTDLERLRMVIASSLEASGLGKVTIATGMRPDPNAHHHAGTTRMHSNPRSGVVNSDGRVHGMDNLYVTGGSVFPTAGFANPTLTIVALALKLADHLKRTMNLSVDR